VDTPISNPETGAFDRADGALTKFRVPRTRHRALHRGALVDRLRAAILDASLVLVAAPAGYGKTTALAQAAAALDGASLAWITLDEYDDDPNRFYATLLRALAPLDLEFTESRSALIAAAGAGGTPGRAAIGALVNALCSMPARRIVIVLDDLHRVTRAETYGMLEALVERLPGHVALVLSGRESPPLPLARWVVRGEAVEFGRTDLRLDGDEAHALALKFGGIDDPSSVQRALARTDGWAAGLSMLLRTSGDAPGDGSVDARLYDYLATEVLAALPHDLRQFVTDVAVLAELTPHACAAVTGRGDAHALLRELLDRDLFVTVLDSRRPVLRYHDLFRDFLRSMLAAQPAHLQTLHARAALAERSYSEAMHHWLAAGEWRAALDRLLAASDELFAEGGHAAVERWLDALPPDEVDREPVWHYLRGVCAWRRWDWFRSRAALTRAAELWPDGAPAKLRARTLLYLMGSRNGLGDAEGALGIAEELRALPLADDERAALALQNAWCRMGRGEGGRVVEELRAAVTFITRDPVGAGVPSADRAHSVYIGLPGALDAYRELLAAYAVAQGPVVEPWHGAPAIIQGWVALWEADATRAGSAVASAHDIVRRFGSVPPLEDGLARLESILCGTTGRTAQGLAIAGRLVARFESAAAAPLRIAFESAYVHCQSRVAWSGGDHESFCRFAPRASRPPRAEEWAFVDVAARTIPAQLALLDRRWQRAADLCTDLIPRYMRSRCPMAHADPRIGLAHALLRLGRTRDALAAFDAVLEECVADRAIGLLVLEPDWLVAPLVDALPAARSEHPEIAPWLARLREWRELARAGTPVAVAAPSGPLAALSERERDVLARVADGASNKDVARALDLSLHTVKRHIANILGKLDCVSRRQAAELYRTTTRAGTRIAG
jgi:LuxR family maltose regulon positive regulatory protein